MTLIDRIRTFIGRKPHPEIPELDAAQTAAGFASELSFWDLELSLKGIYAENIRSRLDPDRMIHEFPEYTLPVIRALTVRLNRLPRVLDVGSGPLSMFGYAAYYKLIDLTAVDPLGNAYLKLLDKYSYHLINYRLQDCPGESLSRLFPRNSFDIVWIHNALDHSQNPRRVIQEMFRVLRHGGYFYYAGYSREGTAEQWYGLHKHDITLEAGGKLMCTSQTGRSDLPWVTTCLNAGLGLEPVELSEPSQAVKTWTKALWRKE